MTIFNKNKNIISVIWNCLIGEIMALGENREKKLDDCKFDVIAGGRRLS